MSCTGFQTHGYDKQLKRVQGSEIFVLLILTSSLWISSSELFIYLLNIFCIFITIWCPCFSPFHSLLSAVNCLNKLKMKLLVLFLPIIFIKNLVLRPKLRKTSHRDNLEIFVHPDTGIHSLLQPMPVFFLLCSTLLYKKKHI